MKVFRPSAVVAFVLAALLPCGRSLHAAGTPTFYRDVLPILQQHCQSCHRPGEIAPMPLVTYDADAPARSPDCGRCPRAQDAAVVRRSARRPFLERSFALAAGNRDARGVGRGECARGKSGRRASATALGRRLEHSAARSGGSHAEAGRRFRRCATSSTPTRSFPRDSRKASGCRCLRFGRRAARTCTTRSSTFARRIRRGCGTRRSACRSRRRT